MVEKFAAQQVCVSIRERLTDLSHRIHSHPELGFEEEKASTWLCEMLADAGFLQRCGARVLLGAIDIAFDRPLRERLLRGRDTAA